MASKRNIFGREGIMSNGRVLVTDDDTQSRKIIAAFLEYKGYEVKEACDADQALDIVKGQEIDLIITDLMMPKCNGLDFLIKMKNLRPQAVVIACSAYGNGPMKTKLLKSGAFFYFDKPIDFQELEIQVKRGIEHGRLQRKVQIDRPEYKRRNVYKNLIGESKAMLAIYELIEKVAESDTTVLIQGESGTGKELVARAIHDLSHRKSRNYVPVNCGAIPDELMESELFGHVKGAFTGAIANRIGRFEMADKGTLFLDEIGDMKIHLQVKLLRVLQSRELEAVGATHPRKIDVRFIAATNQNLEQCVEEKKFREDLYYRLSVIPIYIPPLRERRDDIPLLLNSFREKFNKEKMRNVTGFDSEVMEILCNFNWPGNVRELENFVERQVIIKGEGKVTPYDLPEKYMGKRMVSAASHEPMSLPHNGIDLNSAMEELENRLIMQALEKSGGNKKEAAALLRLKRTTFIEKLKKKKIFNDFLVSEPCNAHLSC
jgi:DNA-binding NtrC family response regulator